MYPTLKQRRIAVAVASTFALLASGAAFAGTPYTGTPIALPGAFEAENFDKGGEGQGYHDLSAGNSGGQYRASEGVDIVASTDAAGGGYVVNNFQSGEWLAYTVTVAAAGTYDFALRVANNMGAPTAFHLEVDGVNVSGNVAVPVTGSWSTFQWAGKNAIALTPGKHTLKIVADQQYFNLNSIRVTANTLAPVAGMPYTGTPTSLPGTFEAENFDKGGEGVGYHDLSAGNTGGQYRTAESVDIIASNDAQGGGYLVNNFQTGEWLAYTVNVAATGTYDLAIRAANSYSAPTAFHMEVDGANVTGSIAVPNTGGWGNFQWVGKQGVALTAGKHVLKVFADAQYFNVNQVRVTASTVAGGGTPPVVVPPVVVTPPAPTLPSTNTRAVATFESLGLYWKPGSNPGSAGCQVQYRKSGDTAWKSGLPMWYDARDGECRGSLVQLAPGTAYEVQFGLPGQAPVAQVNAKTWSNSFPIAKTVQVAPGSNTLNITEGGSPTGYVLYTAAPGTTLDAANARQFNVNIAASYVIVRGLTLKGAQQDAIRIQAGMHDVVIEDNDISGFGRYASTNSAGWQIGMNQDAGIAAYCGSTPSVERVIIQRNRIHDPRYGANSWSDGHPSGANAIMFSYCGGNHVFRHNEIYSSDEKHYFMDGMGGEDNFSNGGFPNADSDIYGNIVKHAWDDAIEAEGANRNVRVWGNYIDQTATGVASTAVQAGPIYIFRNVYNRSRQLANSALDADDRNTFAKSGSASSFGGGRRYVFHNTLLQAPPPAGSAYTLGAGSGLVNAGSTTPLTNTVSRNNVFHIWKDWWSSIDQGANGSGNDLDYDLYNGNIQAYSGAESHAIKGTPVYQAGNGWSSEAGGQYQLSPSSPGFDRGVRLPNFNDDAQGTGPDMGAHEAGSAPMKFGVKAGTPG
jgi:hypothetical protein